jgi:hypothetical protein
VATDAGYWLLWQPEAFAHVRDYETWARELEEPADLERHVAAGAVVPITIGEDGAYRFDVRSAWRARRRLRRGSEAALDERERRYLAAASAPYLLVTHGTAALTGIESVGAARTTRGGRLDLTLPAGRWVVTVHVLAWDDEPGMADPHGQPVSGALPDFLLLLNPEADEPPAYRLSAVTFG